MAKVFLSAGHGGSDPGAVAYGMREKEINLTVMLACNEVLLHHGVTTVLSRTGDENDPVAQEVKEANASKADLAVSFHINAGGGDGFEAFYYTKSSKAKKLAQLAEKHVKALGQNSRGIKSGNHLYFINKTTMTAVLFESFFIDNDKDNDIGDTVAEQKAFGVAYAKAILEYLGIEYEGTASASKPTTSTNTASAATPFVVKFNDSMSVRTGAGTKYPEVIRNGKPLKCLKNVKYTIVEVKKNGSTPWGRLKSGAGWVSLASKYCTIV